jgi:hypothetical protein
LEIGIDIIFERFRFHGNAEPCLSVNEAGILDEKAQPGMEGVVESVLPIVRVHEVLVSAEETDSDNRNLVQWLIGGLQVEDGIVPDLEFRQEPGTAEFPGAQTDGGAHIHDFVIVQMDSGTEFIGLPFLAVEDEGVGLFGLFLFWEKAETAARRVASTINPFFI